MIQRTTFVDHWERICRRFRRPFDEMNMQDAEDYFAFLNEHMEQDEFVGAAQAVWATAKWFPRPSDFLAVRAGMEWRKVLEMVQRFDNATWRGLSQAARLATEAVGGTTGIAGATNVVRIRQAWLESYERELEAKSLERLPPSGRRVIPNQAQPYRLPENDWPTRTPGLPPGFDLEETVT